MDGVVEYNEGIPVTLVRRDPDGPLMVVGIAEVSQETAIDAEQLFAWLRDNLPELRD